ncbi:hypothetical protein J4229_01555 [Candidatus Pacearchaeota archaeon]|nr:hypothetical protein [Candidatus Pacearchaeota archaeon]
MTTSKIKFDYVGVCTDSPKSAYFGIILSPHSRKNMNFFEGHSFDELGSATISGILTRGYVTFTKEYKRKHRVINIIEGRAFVPPLRQIEYYGKMDKTFRAETGELEKLRSIQSYNGKYFFKWLPNFRGLFVLQSGANIKKDLEAELIRYVEMFS